MEEFKKKGYYPAGGRSQTSSAGSIIYINTDSGLEAQNIQDAIDYLAVHGADWTATEGQIGFIENKPFDVPTGESVLTDTLEYDSETSEYYKEYEDEILILADVGKVATFKFNDVILEATVVEDDGDVLTSFNFNISDPAPVDPAQDAFYIGTSGGQTIVYVYDHTGGTDNIDIDVELNAGYTKLPAIKVSYDNTTSDLAATDVQGAIDNLAVNYIVEQGTDTSIQNTTWIYRKWDNGFIEAWFVNTKTIESTVWSGAGLTNTNRFESSFDFPHTDLFISYNDLPLIIAGRVANGFGFPVFYRTAYTGTKGIVSYALSSNLSGSQTVIVWGYVTGNWK